MLSDEQIKAALALASHSSPVRLPQGWQEFARAIEREARQQALEEAAQVCDSVDNYANPMTARDCADAIRALKEQP